MKGHASAAALLIAACLPLSGGGAEPPGGAPAEAVHLGTFVWDLDAPWFGGFSGLEVGADGASFLLLSDRVRLVSGRFRRDARGVVAGVEAEEPMALPDVEGNPLRGRRADSEGLAIIGGRMFVSFEGLARVREEGRDGAPPRLLPAAPAWERLPPNAALEALAADGEGRLLAVSERPPRGEDGFPVWRLEGETWRELFRIPDEGGFDPVGADWGPDGRLYVLFRAFTGLGFRSRLVRFDADGRGEALMETATGVHDNLESVAVWEDAEGLRATMVADDNFRFLQRTEIVDYRLPP